MSKKNAVSYYNSLDGINKEVIEWVEQVKNLSCNGLCDGSLGDPCVAG